MNTWNARRVMLAVGCVLIAVPSLLLASIEYASQPKFPHETAMPPVEGPKSLPVNANIEELADFKTHLPILVMEFAKEPEIHSVWNSDLDSLERIMEDPFVDGKLSLYSNEAKPNRLTDKPALTTRITGRLRGNSSLSFAKHQYLVRMVDEENQEKRLDVLGMGKDSEWIINNSYIDKSLIRTYLCLTIAGRVMWYAPRVRFCELFQKRGETYEYLGLYLIMESIKRGENRVPLSRYNPYYAETAYLLRRDRYNRRSVVLDTFGSIHNLNGKTTLEVRYPGRKRVTDKSIAFIEDDISNFERILYSDTPKEFATYRDMIDLRSFVDYFVINEFFGNYDAGNYSVYISKDIRGKLRLGPLWDFDQSLGNNAPYNFITDGCAMQTGVWFDRLVKDAFFSRQIIYKYKHLRRNFFNDKNIGEFVDNVVAYLGDARIRDWNRWQYNNRETLQRDKIKRVHPALLSNTRSFEEEIDHIKMIMRQHGAWLDKNLDAVVLGNTIVD